MNSLKTKDQIFRLGFIPTLKNLTASRAAETAEALRVGGLNLVEMPFDHEDAAACIRTITENCGVIVGAGEISNAEQATRAIEAGAEFLITKTVDETCIRLGREHEVAVLPHCSNVADIRTAYEDGVRLVEIAFSDFGSSISDLRCVAATMIDMGFVITLDDKAYLQQCLAERFTYAIRAAWLYSERAIAPMDHTAITMAAEDTVTQVHDFALQHIGINTESSEHACGVCNMFNKAFRFTPRDNGPSSRFAGIGVEVMKSIYRGEKGHIAIRTNNVDRAILYLADRGYEIDWSTVYYNGGRIITIYLKEDYSFGGFAVHLVQKA